MGGFSHFVPDDNQPSFSHFVPDGSGSVPPDITANPHGEGTYAMRNDKGQNLGIPYGNVQQAQQKGYKFNSEQDGWRYQKDHNYATTGPGHEAAYAQSDQNAPLPMQAISGIVKGIGTMGKPVMDLIGRASGVPQNAIDSSLQAQTPTERAGKVGMMGAAVAPAAIVAPVATGIGLVGGTLGAGAGQLVANATGASPENTALLQDAGGIAGGLGASKLSSIASRAIGRALLLGRTPQSAMESALKPSTALSQSDRAALVKTALENALPVSKGGVSKIGDLIDALNQKIQGTIASDPNRPIDPNAVATRISPVVSKFSNQVNAQPDLNAISASRQQFLTEQGALPGVPEVPPQPTGILDAQGRPYMDAGTPAQPSTPAPAMKAIDAQAMKQGTYRVLKGKYGEQGSASTEAQKALARGLKEEIANQFPEINNLNSAESRLLDLQPVLERAVNRASNHQAIGIGTPVAGVAAEALTGSPGIGRVAMVMKGVLDNPSVKSRLAISISKSNGTSLSSATRRVNSYAALLGASAANHQMTSGNHGQSTTQPPSE